MTYSHPIFLAQSGLLSLGFKPGPADGLNGPRTRAAFDASLPDHVTLSHSMAGKVVELALQEVGIREIPVDSNRGKRVEEYQAATWLDGSGWAWCAAFIVWLCREAGMAENVRPRTAGAWDFENWAKKKSAPAQLIRITSGTKIKKGDILVFKQSHIGLAVADQVGSTVKTVEGNTNLSGSREGGGVFAKDRKVSKFRSIIRLS